MIIVHFVQDQNQDKNGSIDFMAIIAEIASFFVDVYETSSLTLTYLLYHISKNQKIQDNLRKKVKQLIKVEQKINAFAPS